MPESGPCFSSISPFQLLSSGTGWQLEGFSPDVFNRTGPDLEVISFVYGQEYWAKYTPHTPSATILFYYQHAKFFLNTNLTLCPNSVAAWRIQPTWSTEATALEAAPLMAVSASGKWDGIDFWAFPDCIRTQSMSFFFTLSRQDKATSLWKNWHPAHASDCCWDILVWTDATISTHTANVANEAETLPIRVD